MKQVAIINYGSGNLYSLQNSFRHLGISSEITHCHQEISNSSHIVLPGVGAFTPAIKKIKEKKLDQLLAQTNQNILGICLGMQLLFEESEETMGQDQKNTLGLSLLPGKVKSFSKNNIVPHTCWNDVEITQENTLTKGLDTTITTYFAHSYYVHLKKTTQTFVKGISHYDDKYFPTLIEQNNIFSCQFHPEKSADVGLKILENFINL